MGNDDRHDDRHDDDWDRFDWNHWGVKPDADGVDDGRAPTPAEADHYGDGFLRPALADVDDEAETSAHAADGRWVTHGGVLSWQANADEEEGVDAPLREEAKSPWASDEITLPLAAPATARVRAVRAWMGRRRLRETELIGELLLERRRLAGAADAEESDTSRAAPENPHDPLALALAEAQAAADEYETLLGMLEDVRAHVGPQAALVEFYLSVNDRLATLAADPAATEGFAESALFDQIERRPARDELTPSARSEWEGRAGAALATRRRVEQVNATEPEDD